MINQLRTPYQFWNHPIFTEPKGSVKPIQHGTISYLQAARFRDVASAYFKTEKLDANEIRLRKPPGEVADVSSTITRPFESMRIATSKITCLNHFSSLVPIITFQYQYLAYQMKCKDYDNLLQTLTAVLNQFGFPQSIILPIYGYIASVCQNSPINEIRFLKDIERFSCQLQEHPHINHLFDELASLFNSNQYPTLLHLLIGDIDNAVAGFSKEPHAIPVLSSRGSLILNLGFLPHQNVTDHLLLTKYHTLRSMPQLRFLEEEYEIIPYQEEPGVTYPDLLKANRLQELISLTTQHIQTNHYDYLTFLFRSYAFIKFRKYRNAFNDINQSLAMKYTNKAEEIRDELCAFFGNSLDND